MPLTVTDVDELQDYISGVMERAGHHAGNVDEVALALVGAILWRKDDDADIRVMAQNGEAKNVPWVRIGGQRYAFSYNHKRGDIEMREGEHARHSAPQILKCNAVIHAQAHLRATIAPRARALSSNRCSVGAEPLA